MPANSADSAAPGWALPVWCDANNIYVEYLSAREGQPPFVVKYARTATGYQEALKAMLAEHDKRQPKAVYTPQVPVSPITKVAEGRSGRSSKVTERVTSEQRNKALETLKKLNLLK